MGNHAERARELFMNVTINGYITFKCNSCGKSHTLERQSHKFEEDTSKEAEDDEYIRYLSKIDTPCPACSSRILVNVDVWEFPAAVVNYSYYGEDGAGDIQCEFSIEHYFDEQSMTGEDTPYEPPEENDIDQEDDPDDEDAQDAPPPIEVYIDRYEDEDEY